MRRSRLRRCFLSTRDRILAVLGTQLSATDLNASPLSFDDLRMGAVEEWDSLTNLNLLLAIENEFSVRFSTEELASIQSLQEIERFLTERSQ